MEGDEERGLACELYTVPGIQEARHGWIFSRYFCKEDDDGNGDENPCVR